MRGETWSPPRCRHDHIILGCPDEDCPEQNAYLDLHEAMIGDYLNRQLEAARRLVRDALGLPAGRANEPPMDTDPRWTSHTAPHGPTVDSQWCICGHTFGMHTPRWTCSKCHCAAYEKRPAPAAPEPDKGEKP